MKAVVKYTLAGILTAALCVGMGFLYRNVRQEASRIVCGRLEVNFTDSLQFVSEQDVRAYLDNNYGAYIGERLDSVQLARIEDMLESRSAVMRAEAWTTDDGVLHVDITQRAPVLRFQNGDRGFYVDDRGYIFPLHPSYTAPVPVVEGAIPVDVPAGYKGEAREERERACQDREQPCHQDRHAAQERGRLPVQFVPLGFRHVHDPGAAREDPAERHGRQRDQERRREGRGIQPEITVHDEKPLVSKTEMERNPLRAFS